VSRTLVLLHGFLGAPAAWDPVQAALGATRDLRVLRPTLPGHGLGATGAPSTWDETVETIAAELPLAPAVVAGYSNGGRLALGLLARHPERVAALVLVSAHLGLAEPSVRAARAEEDDHMARLAEEKGIEALVEAHSARPVLASQAALPPTARAVLAARRRSHVAQAIAATLRASGLGAMPDLRLPLVVAGRRGMPVIALAGEEDPTYVARAREAATLSGGRSVIAAGCGHDLLLEAPELVAEAIADVLAAPARGPAVREERPR
jgi:2-succinyl-6-hydroxy-2,4-cyclohexadiene-1-carboxylate synthase